MRIYYLITIIVISFLSAGLTPFYNLIETRPEGTLDEKKQFKQVLCIYINPDIPQNGLITNGKARAAINEYRLTLEHGFERTFGQYFNNLFFVANEPDKGLALELKKINITHEESNGKTMKYRIDYQADLKKDGIIVSSVSNAIVSDPVFAEAKTSSNQSVYADTLNLFFSDMGNKLFKNIIPEKIYTAYNIWDTGDDVLWAINYKTGDIIPAGTEINDITFFSKDEIHFTLTNSKKKLIIKFKDKYHPGKTVIDYCQYLFTTKNFKELTAGLTADEIDAIERGAVIKGMPKEAVIISYGYPPEHKTRSLESLNWLYWINRQETKTICFNKQNQAIACVQSNDL